METWDGGIEGGDGGKEHPPATRMEVPMGPCQRGNPGNFGAGEGVVRGGGGGDERERSSDGMVAELNPQKLRAALSQLAVSKIEKGGVRQGNI